MKPGLLWSTVRAMPIVLAGLLMACSVGLSRTGDEIVPGIETSQPGAQSSTAPSAHSVARAVGQADPDSLAASTTVSTTIDLPHIQRNFEGTPPAWWQPPINTSWQWQLTDPLDLSFDVDMYDIDLFDNTASTVAALHAQGRKVLCYVSVGSWEDWRPDADQFPESVLGNDYEGWPGERWLDIRQIELLAPIMRARFDLCQAKGFDGIEPDNIDGYTNDTGFPLTYQDQLTYNIWLANEAHARGLSIGLKNDDEQVGDLLPHFDWAMTEDCFADEWCTEMEPFIAAGKAVFAAEYTDQMTVDQFLNQVCPQAEAMAFSAILKGRDLDAWRRGCP
jgi:endo-alpha-1,4-polygalactosaminidase (GH114 family)